MQSCGGVAPVEQVLAERYMKTSSDGNLDALPVKACLDRHVVAERHMQTSRGDHLKASPVKAGLVAVCWQGGLPPNKHDWVQLRARSQNLCGSTLRPAGCLGAISNEVLLSLGEAPESPQFHIVV